MNCTADVRRDRCEIWGPLQSSDTVQRDAAAITGLPPSAITVHTTFLGGGFGRKWPVGVDFSSEAILVSQAIRRPGQKSPLHRAVLERAAREVVGTKGRRRGAPEASLFINTAKTQPMLLKWPKSLSNRRGRGEFSARFPALPLPPTPPRPVSHIVHSKRVLNKKAFFRNKPDQ